MTRRRKNRHRGNYGGSRGDNGGNRSGSGWNRNTDRPAFALPSGPGDLVHARNEQNVSSSENSIIRTFAFNDSVAAGRVQKRRRRRRARRPLAPANTHSPTPITSHSNDGGGGDNTDNATEHDATGDSEESQTLKEVPLRDWKHGVQSIVSNTQCHHVGPMVERVLQRARVDSAVVYVVPNLPLSRI